ncbi:P-loop containing nucleoside triphosphate hydrolase protein [Sesbania bispinosa]|nr:P-loop containing nucleoside triphosphate hydrolase protein [Sesbania bispinosa]
MGGDSKIPQSRVEKRSFNGGSSMSSASMANGVKDDYLNCNYFSWIKDMDSAECESDMDAWMKNHLNFKLKV